MLWFKLVFGSTISTKFDFCFVLLQSMLMSLQQMKILTLKLVRMFQTKNKPKLQPAIPQHTISVKVTRQLISVIKKELAVIHLIRFCEKQDEQFSIS